MVIDEYGLSAIQGAMLSQHLSDPRSGVDIEQIVIEYNEAVDAVALGSAWENTIKRNPALRTTFVWDNAGEPLQRVHDSVPFHFEIRPAPDTAQQFEQFLHEDRERGFDLAEPPLLRLTLFVFSPQHFRLVWTVHHIVVDGRAFRIILRDVERFYQAARPEQEVNSPPAPQFRDYIDWLKTVDTDGADEFWSAYLTGLSKPSTLPYDSAWYAQDAAADCDVIEDRLPPEISSRLGEIVEQHGATLNTLSMAIWGILLHKYSGESDIVFGTIKTTRGASIPGADAIVGIFLNTLPVRLSLRPEARFVDVLKELRHDWLSLRAFEHTPLPRIKRAAGFAVQEPIFQSLVVYDSPIPARAEVVPIQDRDFKLLERTGFPLTLSVTGGPALLLKLEFDPTQYSRRTAEQILTHARRLYESVAEDPSQLIGDFSILDTIERKQLLEGWNATANAYPSESLATLIESQVRRTPDEVAVEHEGQRLTYSELNCRANQLAAELLKHGVKRDDAVALCVERSELMLVALLAIVKSGAGYVPLDPWLPAERLRYMLEDSGALVLITQTDLQEDLAFAGPTLLLDKPLWLQNSSHNPVVDVGANDLAYILYTSGSTGKPKGVEVSRSALINLLWSVKDLLRFGKDRLLAVTTISFDIAGADMWLPLLTGARCVICSREGAADGAYLSELIADRDITFMQATPVTWRLLFDSGWKGKADLQVVCTGEAMPRELATKLLTCVPKVWNLYGPTETTIWSTGFQVISERGPILIGRPLANTQCYILDVQGEPVPAGSTGELWIGGHGVARGYLNRKELTAEKFVQNPFRPGERMYRTGDLARHLPDGNIQCLGRIDHQVKIRGYRIELGEIETMLAEQLEIKQAAVVPREESPGNLQLAAYLVTADSMSVPSPTELRERLSSRLPDYMLPALFFVVPEMPISANGKVDRNALLKCNVQAESSGGMQYESATQGELPGMVCRAFARVLDFPEVRPDDDFFALGGHSLTAARAIGVINKQFGLRLGVRVLFQASTPEKLATIIHKHLSSESVSGDEWSTLIEIQPNGSHLPLFCVARPNVNALGFLALARELGDDQPVYGLQARLEEDPELEFTPEQIASTASEYIQAMKKIQKRGPYRLVGQCQGAYIAFEMTRQLESNGEEVSFLGMLDTWPDENTRIRWKFRLYSALKHLSASKVLSKLRKRLLPVHQLNGNLESPGRRAVPRPLTLSERYWPGTDFRPAICLAPIVVFRVKSQFWFRIKDETLGWNNRTRSGVRSYLVPGDHLTFSRLPHVKELANRVADSLEDE